MSLIQIILRSLPTPRNNLLKQTSLTKIPFCHKSQADTSSSSSSSSSSSDSDDEIRRKSSSEDAVKRLNTLLQQMVLDDAVRGKESIKLAQPTNKRVKEAKGTESVTTEPVEKQMVNAVKDVAQSLGGDTKQTESELLIRLLNPVENQEGSSSSLSEILKGMKIEREAKPQQSKAEQVRSVLQRFSSKTRAPQKPTDQRRPKRLNVPAIEQV